MEVGISGSVETYFASMVTDASKNHKYHGNTCALFVKTRGIDIGDVRKVMIDGQSSNYILHSMTGKRCASRAAKVDDSKK